MRGVIIMVETDTKKKYRKGVVFVNTYNNHYKMEG